MIEIKDFRGTSPPASPFVSPPIAPQSAENKGVQGPPALGGGFGAAPPIILAVKNFCRQEQEDWWAAILADRVARTTLFGLREDQKTFKYWFEMAADPGNDLNVVYGPDGAKLAFFWTSGRLGYSAFLHFGFLEIGLPWKMEIGHYVLKVLALAGYRCLAGLTPAFNRHVAAYALALGATVMGRWPGVCYVAARNEWVDGILMQFNLEGD
jgi:hypothetical protein